MSFLIVLQRYRIKAFCGWKTIHKEQQCFPYLGSLTQRTSSLITNYETLGPTFCIVAISKSDHYAHALSLSTAWATCDSNLSPDPCFAFSTHSCNRLTASDILYCPRSKESRVSMNCQHLISVSCLTKEYTAESFCNSTVFSLAFSSHSFNSSAINRYTCT